jgi:predicted enzyme related to lactoylglutathione lyase
MGARIGHIAIFSENPSNLAKFYGEVFGIKVTGVDDLGNAWVTDGYMDIALLRRRNEKAPKAGINHFGFTIDPADRPALLAKMKKYGIEPYSPYVDAPEAHRPYAEDAVKDPMGNRFDVSTGMKDVRGGTGATELAQGQRPVIRHIALFSDDTEKLAQFYGECFGMKRTGESKGDIWITDGWVDFALLSRKRATAPHGIHHWGFTIPSESRNDIYQKLTAKGFPPSDPRAEDPTIDRPYVEDKGHDIDGNRFDLTTAKRDMDEEKRRTKERLARLVPAK